jgi:hypothetical protein
MVTTNPTQTEHSELQDLEEHALEHLEEEGVAEEPETLTTEPEEELAPVPVSRVAVVVIFSILAAAVMAGGVFKGFSPRIWAAIGGILGVSLGAIAYRVRNAIASNVVIVAGIFAIGIIMTIPAGALQDILTLGAFVREAIASGDVQRPPVPYTLGWAAILGWLMGALGFAAAWVGMQFRRPALGLMVPLPIVAIAAISVADDAKLVSGLLAMAFFAIGLGMLSGVDLGEKEQRSIAYEIRRGMRALPMIAAITVGLYFLAQTNFLFPKPVFDPTQQAQRPKTTPIQKVPDRVLFSVKSQITGPWRMGGLDVYDKGEWLLPPFAENRIKEVPRSGIVDSELNPGVRADIEIGDLGGAVLPGLPNLVGLIAEGPKMAYDSRTGNIRMGEGVIEPGLRYTVTAGRIPTVEELRNVSAPPPSEVKQFLEVPPPPPAVRELLNRAPKSSPWDTVDFLRQELLNKVAASGPGTPVPVPVEKVQDMLVGTKEGSPFEIVAGQALLARWAGVPSRIGYGFDGGEKVGDHVEVRPKHGASFLEVYFPGYKWLPIIGTPRLSRSSLGSDPTQQNQDVLASDDIAVKIFVPTQTDSRTYLFEQLQRVALIVLPFVILILLIYYGWPGIRKAIIRARRRSWAQSQGIRERIAVAYAEWRDVATDFGYRYNSDTPLMFLDRVVEDDEHTEFAWLVTRALWGDLQDQLRQEDANAADELSQSLKKRLSQAHASTLRLIALVSRLSLRFPYAPKLGAVAGSAEEPQKEKQVAKAA